MEIIVNIIKLSTDLAHNAARDEMINRMDNSYINYEEEMYVDDNESVYTEDAQKVFNGWYNYFYNEIKNHENKIKELSNIIFSLEQAVIANPTWSRILRKDLKKIKQLRKKEIISSKYISND